MSVPHETAPANANVLPWLIAILVIVVVLHVPVAQLWSILGDMAALMPLVTASAACGAGACHMRARSSGEPR